MWAWRHITQYHFSHTGVINTVEGVYRSPVTGDSLTIDEAIEKRLIAGILLSVKTRRSALPEPQKLALFTERLSYTITHAKNTVTGNYLKFIYYKSCHQDLWIFNINKKVIYYWCSKSTHADYITLKIDRKVSSCSWKPIIG